MSSLLGMKCVQKDTHILQESLREKCYRLTIEQKLDRKLNSKSNYSHSEFCLL